MYKELILAIILGAFLGFGVTGGFVMVKKNQSQNQTISSVPTLIPSPNPSGTNQKIATPTPNLSTVSLTIDSPTNESITDNAKITITGSTQANNLIIIKTPIDNYQTTADNAGNFELDVEIESGANYIQISAIDSLTNQQNDSQILVTYSTAKI